MYDNYRINHNAINNYDLYIKEFYGRGPIIFKNITDENIKQLKQKSLNYNEIYNRQKITKLEKYLRIMRMIRCSKLKGYFNNDAEKLICFMFSVDPTFEIIKIVNEFNKVNETRIAIIKKFGVYDINLIKLEKYYISHFLSKEEKEKLDEEIQKRIWK